MSDEPRTWRLYVDESGDFSCPGDRVLVAGVLVCSDPANDKRFKQALRGIAPYLPDPLHTADAFRTSTLALAIHAAWENAEDDGYGTGRYHNAVPSTKIRDAARAVARRLEEERPKLVQAAREELKNGRYPDYDDGKELERCLAKWRLEDQGAQQIVRAIEDHSKLLQEQIKYLLWGVEESLKRLDYDAGPWLVVAAEVREKKPEKEKKRYLGLLSVLLERVAAVVGRGEGPRQVRLHVLERGLERRSDRSWDLLDVRHVEQLAQTLGRSGEVKLIAEEVQRFHETKNPWYGIADHAACMSRRVMNWNNKRTVRQFEKTLAWVVGCQAGSGKPRASHLACSGEPRHFILTYGRPGALEPGEKDRDEMAGYPRWAREQACEWASILRGQS